MSDVIFRWSPADDISLSLCLAGPSGEGVVGAFPELAIRRVRASHGGALDGWYWDGSVFQSTPTWLPLAEFDAVSNPGLYTYLFAQSAIGSEWVYTVYYRHTTDPVGFAVETHVVSNELFIPQGSPIVPVFPGDTVMGRLAAMEVATNPVALANADAVWDELASQHLAPGSTGEALSRLVGLLHGAYQITIHVEDDSPAPIQGAQIDVFDHTNSHFLGRVYSDVNGDVAVALDTGVYAVRIFRSGYAFTVPEVLTVTADGAVTYSGTSLVIIIPPSDPNLCAIYGIVRDASGSPVPNARVTAYAVTPQVAQGTQQSSQVSCTVTDGNGFFRLELERGATVNWAIEATGLDVTRVVPDAPSQDVATWI